MAKDLDRRVLRYLFIGSVLAYPVCVLALAVSVALSEWALARGAVVALAGFAALALPEWMARRRQQRADAGVAEFTSEDIIDAARDGRSLLAPETAPATGGRPGFSSGPDQYAPDYDR
jgi:hypothetical protein